MDRLKDFGASQYQLANLQNALSRLRIARVPFLAEDILTNNRYHQVVSAIRELGETATPEAHVALVKFWRTRGDCIYESQHEETVPDYNDSSGFATARWTEKIPVMRVIDELEGAARERCGAAKLQADQERGLK